MKSNKLEFSRLDLYKLVWSQPISKISKQLEIKESLIRQKCEEYNIPTGKLIFVIELRSWRRKEIADIDVIMLEDKIDRIIEEIIHQGMEEVEYQKELIIRQEKERKRQELETTRINQINTELKKLKEVLMLNERWHKAMIMRQYIIEYHKHFNAKNELTEDRKDWISWALDKAD